MGFDGAGRQEQPGADLVVGQPETDELEDLDLSARDTQRPKRVGDLGRTAAAARDRNSRRPHHGAGMAGQTPEPYLIEEGHCLRGPLAWLAPAVARGGFADQGPSVVPGPSWRHQSVTACERRRGFGDAARSTACDRLGIGKVGAARGQSRPGPMTSAPDHRLVVVQHRQQQSPKTPQ